MATAAERHPTTAINEEGAEHLLDAVIEQTPDYAVVNAVTRAEIDMKIATAKRFPRSFKEFKHRLADLVSVDQETAGGMFYVLPARQGSDKKIEGPSVRLAEAVCCTYGNIMAGTRVIAVEKEFVVASGWCHDLETNYSAAYEVRRRIVNKYGKRFNADMIQVTCNAASAIAYREAVFKVVPRSLFKTEYELARKTSLGKMKSLSEGRAAAFDWWAKAGVQPDKILAWLERKGVEEVSLDDLVTLRGLATSVRDGELLVENAFDKKDPEEKRVSVSPVSDQFANQSAHTDLPVRREATEGTDASKEDSPAPTEEAAMSSTSERGAGESHSAVVDSTLDRQAVRSKFELFVPGDEAKARALYDSLLGPDAPEQRSTEDSDWIHNIYQKTLTRLVKQTKEQIKAGKSKQKTLEDGPQ